jgi:hypothetical protein
MGNSGSSGFEDAPSSLQGGPHVFATKLRSWVAPISFFGFLLALLVWDMKKVQMMSQRIHDDHLDNWEEIHNKVNSKWLSAVDLCMLNISEPEQDVKAYKAKNCSRIDGRIVSSLNSKLYCSIGSSLGKPCPAPLSSRSFFLSQLRPEIWGNDSSNYISSFARKNALSGKSIVFIGDGISKQHQDAFVCELQRTERVIISGTMKGGSLQKNASFSVRWKDSSLKLDVVFMKLLRISKDAGHSIGTSRNIGITSTKSSPGYTFAELKQTIDILLHAKKGIVIVANMGVAYNSRELFRRDIAVLLSWLNDIGRDPQSFVFFRETASQHWNHSGNGYFERDETGDEETVNGTCVPLADATPGR